MKKIILFLFTLLITFTMVACNDNKPNRSEILEDSSTSYYIGNYSNNWIADTKDKMVATNLEDSLLKKLTFDENNVKHLYIGHVNLGTDANFSVNHNGMDINGGLTFEIIKTNTPKDTASYSKIPSYGNYYMSLTANTLHQMNPETFYYGCIGKTSGEYNVILIEYKEKVDGNKYGIGLIAKGINDDVPSEEPTNNPNVDYNEIYDSNNGADILPAGEQLADNVQDGLILHAWNWSYKNIEAQLANIARSGYTTVQVSPVQQPKDYDPKYPKGWAEQWWKFYQPLSFSIAEASWLGTEDELKSLCSAADEYGIKIIVDIVANHMANKEDTAAGMKVVYEKVKDYEPTIYNGKNTYFRPYVQNNDSSVQAVVQGNIGMPDLNTGNKDIQNKVIGLLKECIDCGVDGFRFDAAKHIETPDDGAYASDFWPTVLTAATNYASSKNTSLYYYGEILNTCGNGRGYGSYTKYMSITDNVTGNNIRKAIVSGNASGAAQSTYASGVNANQIVLWAESHDTFANTEQESTNVSDANINKTWALVAARKDATALFFARPGDVGSIGSYQWMSTEVAAVNKFHNAFIGANEKVYSSGNFAVVERYNSNSAGLVIVNCSGTSSNVSFNVTNIANGTYRDEITGNTFTVSNGKINGQIGSTGIAVVTNKTSQNIPSATLSQAGGYFDSTITINIDLTFVTSARVIIGDKTQIITSDSTIKIGDGMQNGQSIQVEICVVNDSYRVTKTYTFIKLSGISENSIVVKDVPESYAAGGKYDVYAWVWKTGKDGRLVKTTLNGTFVVFDVNEGEDNFLLLTVSKGNSVDKNTVWNYKVKQTPDFKIVENGIYSAPKSSWE